MLPRLLGWNERGCGDGGGEGGLCGGEGIARGLKAVREREQKRQEGGGGGGGGGGWGGVIVSKPSPLPTGQVSVQERFSASVF